LAEQNKKGKSPETEKTKKKRRILSSLLLIFTILLLFIVLLISATQTHPFKNWLAGYITDKINESFSGKDAHLTFGSLEGNFFSEIILSDAVLKVKNDDMIRFERLKVHFDIFQLINKKINLSEVILRNPSVNFVKVKNAKGDSVWNLDYLFSSDKEKDTTKIDFEWKINVDRLRIENLNFVMLGVKPQDVPINAIRINPSKSFDIDNLKISSLTLETSAYYDKNSAQLQIGFLDFNSNFGFDLRGLNGNFFLSKSRAEVNKLNIETSKSWVQLDYAFIDKMDILSFEGLPSFKDKDMKLHMVAKKFDFDDLKSFLEPLSFLDGKVYCEIMCDGKFNDFKIDKCILKTEGSDMNFHGRMLNLIDPEHLYIDVAGENFILDPADTKIHLPGLTIPDYSYLGKVSSSFSYKGEPLNFQTTFDVHSSAGDAKGNFSMNLTTPAIDYNGYVETRDGNIGKVLKNEKLQSSLNGNVEFSGSGFSPANIHTKLTYELSNSKFSEYSVDNSSGTISINNYNIDADVKYISHDANLQVAGTINIADFNNPKYSLKGRTTNLNIAAFTKKPADKSNLNFGFDLRGSGLSLNNLEGDFDMDFANSYFGKYDIPATPVRLKISTGGTSDNVSFTSNLFDFKAEGQFKFDQVAETVFNNINLLNNQISRKFNLDTLLPERPLTILTSNVNFNYEFKTKNSEAIAKLFYFEDFKFNGSAKGYIKNNADGFDAQASIDIPDFAYADSLLVLKNAKISMHHSVDYNSYKEKNNGNFAPFNSTVDVTSDKIRYRTSNFDSVRVNWDLRNENQYFRFAVKQDTSLKISANGNIDLSSDSVGLLVKNFKVYYNKLNVQNDNDIFVNYDPSSSERTFNFRKFTLSSDRLKVDVAGKYSISGSSDLTAEFDNIDIPKLLQYIYNRQSIYAVQGSRDEFKTPIRGDITRLLMTYKGTIENPALGIVLNSGLIRYENTKIGRIDAFIDYVNKSLSTDVLVLNSLGQGKLRLTGDIPFNNPLVTPDSSSYTSVMDSPLNLKLKATDFQVNFFSKLIPNFAELSGFLNGELTSTGTITEPNLAGGMNIDKGRFFLEINNLYYRFNASFRAENSDLIVQNFRVSYVDDDRRHLDGAGKINFSGLRVNNIDITTTGDVKVLDRSSKQTRFGFYGDMVAGSGAPAITIKGDLDRLYVEGQLLIKEANLVFPSLQGLEYNVNADDYIYRILNDTSGKRYLDTVVVVKEDNLNELDPFVKYKYQLANKPASFTDNIVFDLFVKTEKNVYVSINFNELTKEELFGEISGDVEIENKNSKDMNFLGAMEIVGDSYYRIYYKNFKIENSRLVFEGPYDNPQLNITAKYQNIRTVNNEQEIVYVVLSITGTKKKPLLAFKLLNETGTEMGGSDETSNALSYLIFGVPQQAVSGQYRADIFGNLGNNVVSTVTSSYLTNLVREVAPFILNTEVIYEGGGFTRGTDFRITSEIGGAIVRFGGKVLSDINNAEVTIDYPLNKLLNMNISNNLLLEIKREVKNTDFSIKNSIETGVGLTYKINF
jgi:hypothetical protein